FGDPGRIARGDLLQREAGRLDPDGAVLLGQTQQRPVAARDNFGALLFLDGGEGEIEMEQREQPQRRRGCRGFAREERRVHAVLIFRRDSAAFAAVSAASRELPVASTMAAEGRLSPAGGITSPG